MNIDVRGNSFGALCCAHLLQNAGLPLRLQRTGRPRLPAIMLSDNALKLIRDVFGKPGLFGKAPRINRRVVSWNKAAAPVALDHSAVVVSEEQLLAELDQDLAFPDRTEALPDFTIFAARPLPPGPREHTFGARIASAVRIKLNDPADSATCWIESLETGWLFLIPGWLLSVGGAPQEMLERSRLIANRITLDGDPAGAFPATPRIMEPLTGPDWLACGTAGMAFDPLCGDGTAYAAREAILASAVLKAIAAGGNPADLRTHYEARLTLGFHRHLVTCWEYYGSGEGGPWWDQQRETLQQGLQWSATKMKTFGPFRYQLDDFDLKPIP